MILKIKKAIQKIKLWDGSQTLVLDELSGTLPEISSSHRNVHNGSMFRCGVNSADLDADAVISISFTTPNTLKHIHMVGEATSTGEAIVEVLEAPTITADSGSVLPVYNRNRNNVATTVVSDLQTSPVAGQATANGTITDDGTQIASARMGEGKNKQGGSTRGMEEWVLKQNTTYSVRVTSNAADNIVQLTLNYYERQEGA